MTELISSGLKFMDLYAPFFFIFKGRIADELAGFLTLIVTKDRYHEIDAILDYFLTEVKSYKGIGIAYVTMCFHLFPSMSHQSNCRGQ